MSFFYNEAKDGAKFASAACSDWSQANSRIDFDELRFCSDDDFFYLFMHALKFDDLIKMGERNWKMPAQLITFKVARKDWEKTDWKTKQKSTVAQSRVEKLVCKVLEGLDDSMTYKGFWHLQDSASCDIILTGKDVTGKDIPEALVPVMMATFCSLEPTELTLFDVNDCTAPAKRSGGWGGSKGQTELEVLNDRFTFLKQQVALKFPDYHVNGLHDLTSKTLLTNNPTEADDIDSIVQLAIMLMG